MLRKLKIIPKEDFNCYDVEVDGAYLENVRGIQINMEAGAIPEVIIQCLANNVEVELPVAQVETQVVEEQEEPE